MAVRVITSNQHHTGFYGDSIILENSCVYLDDVGSEQQPVFDSFARQNNAELFMCCVLLYCVQSPGREKGEFRVKQRTACISTQPQRYLDVQGWERQRESSGLNMQYVAVVELKAA